MKNITAEGVYRIIQDEIRHHQRRKEMRITGRDLRQVIRETLMMEMRGRRGGGTMYGGDTADVPSRGDGRCKG